MGAFVLHTMFSRHPLTAENFRGDFLEQFKHEDSKLNRYKKLELEETWARDVYELCGKYPQTICFRMSSGHFCREVMLYYMQQLMQIFQITQYSRELYQHYYGIIDINLEEFFGEENNNKLFSDFQSKSKQLFDKFNLKDINLHFHSLDINACRISFEIGVDQRTLYFVSAMIYIMSHAEILNHLLSPDVGSLEILEFARYLSKGFLKNDWGDSSNSALGMSIFFYEYSLVKTIKTVANGPCNYGLSANLLRLEDYLSNMFLTVFKSSRDIPAVLWTKGFNYVKANVVRKFLINAENWV